MAGVQRSLTVVMIADVLQLYNNNEVFMAMTMHGGNAYFHSKMTHLSDVKRVCQCISALVEPQLGGSAGFFVIQFVIILLNPTTSKELEEKEKQQKAKDMQQKERERNKFHLNYIV